MGEGNGTGREPGVSVAPWDRAAGRAGIGAAVLDVTGGEPGWLTEDGHGDGQEPGRQ